MENHETPPNKIRLGHRDVELPDAVKAEIPTNPLASSNFIMRIRGDSSVHKVASAISHALHSYNSVTLRTLGAGPNQQALKSIAIASGRERTAGFDLSVRVSMFDEPQADGNMLTIMALTLVKVRI